MWSGPVEHQFLEQAAAHQLPVVPVPHSRQWGGRPHLQDNKLITTGREGGREGGGAYESRAAPLASAGGHVTSESAAAAPDAWCRSERGEQWPQRPCTQTCGAASPSATGGRMLYELLTAAGAIYLAGTTTIAQDLAAAAPLQTPVQAHTNSH